eukprot:GEMP01093470.1.p1 GENE.GEMP01093470.1~~GEMP01093470.1.p1  ORF type:complete len:129 (+),score=3.44 GEMP01093470.1:372-758(+)
MACTSKKKKPPSRYEPIFVRTEKVFLYYIQLMTCAFPVVDQQGGFIFYDAPLAGRNYDGYLCKKQCAMMLCSVSKNSNCAVHLYTGEKTSSKRMTRPYFPFFIFLLRLEFLYKLEESIKNHDFLIFVD